MAKFNEDSFRYKEDGIPTGLYDREILCIACDNMINERCESDAKRKLFDTERTIFNFQEDLGVFPEFDYTTTKLFFLSIFYKASLSNQMSEVNLGKSKEGHLRKMLRTRDAGQASQFGIWMTHINDYPKTFRWLSHIRYMSAAENTRFAFLAGGVVVSMYPHANGIPQFIRPWLLSPNKPLSIQKLHKDKGAEMLDGFFQTNAFSELDAQGIL